MKITSIKYIVTAVLVCSAFVNTVAQITTPDTVKTRLGDLKFERGFPTEETKKKVFDEIDYQRAVQAFLWAYPAVSFESIRMATKEAGIDLNDLFIADNFVNSKGLWLTANDTTIYAVSNIDLGKGPIVVDIPPGGIVGMIEDFWQRSISDVGLPGPDGDKGGKFLMLPPGYNGDVPSSGYHVIKAPQNNYNVMVRGILVGGMDNAAPAVETVRRVKIYPWSERSNPKPNKFVSMTGVAINTLPPAGLEFWSRLSAYINNNPVQDRDLFYMGMLRPLGIEKGKPFQPNARQKAILEEAARIGDAMGRVTLMDGPERFTKPHPFPGTNWHWVFQVNPVQQTDTYGQVDERLHYTYGAIYTAAGLGVMKAGPGGNYVQTFKDKDSNHFDGAKTYKLNVPANAPAAQFWSITVYDTATRSMIQNGGDSAISSYDKMKTNADGSIDLYFGPDIPAGVDAANWRKTVPGKGWYTMFRIYTPKEGLFDGTWKLPDIELVK